MANKLQKCKQHIDNTHSIPQIISEQADAEGYEDEADLLINAFIDAQAVKAANEKRRKEAEINKGSVVAEPAPESPQVTPTPPKAKKTVTINPAEMMASSGSAFIETEQQVEHYLSQLKGKLLAAVKAGDKVRIK